jgi:hypothetical protein
VMPPVVFSPDGKTLEGVCKPCFVCRNQTGFRRLSMILIIAI